MSPEFSKIDTSPATFVEVVLAVVLILSSLVGAIGWSSYHWFTAPIVAKGPAYCHLNNVSWVRCAIPRFDWKVGTDVEIDPRAEVFPGEEARCYYSLRVTIFGEYLHKKARCESPFGPPEGPVIPGPSRYPTSSLLPETAERILETATRRASVDCNTEEAVMKRSIFAALAFLGLLQPTSAQTFGTRDAGHEIVWAEGVVTIRHDTGGLIESYRQRFSELKNSHYSFVIDGLCLSACTLIVHYIPPNRLCVTKRAVLGFHAAWRPGQANATTGEKIPVPEQTRKMFASYPPAMRQWITRQGGLDSDMKFMRGSELRAVIKPCP